MLCNREPGINSHISRVSLGARVLLACSTLLKCERHGIPFAARCGTTIVPFQASTIVCDDLNSEACGATSLPK